MGPSINTFVMCGVAGHDHVHLQPAAVAAESVSEAVVAVTDHAAAVVSEVDASSRRLQRSSHSQQLRNCRENTATCALTDLCTVCVSSSCRQ